ncbi:MAG: type II toxin-antitoxin system VapC family toxin [Rhodothermales bacterium]
MTGIDTNVLVRYLTRDEPDQYTRAKTFLTSRCTPEDPGFLHPIVLCELVWVLKAAYKYSREEIAMVLEKLLQTRQIVIGDRDAVRAALASYRRSSADFADCLIGRLSSEAGCKKTVTFDEQAAELDGFQPI